MTGAKAEAACFSAMDGVFRGRGGASLDIALFEVGVASLVNVAQSALATGEPARRHGNAHPTIVPYQTFETADGPIVVAVGNDGQWRALCAALGPPHFAGQAAWAKNTVRVVHSAPVVADLGRPPRPSPHA